MLLHRPVNATLSYSIELDTLVKADYLIKKELGKGSNN